MFLYPSNSAAPQAELGTFSTLCRVMPKEEPSLEDRGERKDHLSHFIQSEPCILLDLTTQQHIIFLQGYPYDPPSTNPSTCLWVLAHSNRTNLKKHTTLKSRIPWSTLWDHSAAPSSLQSHVQARKSALSFVSIQMWFYCMTTEPPSLTSALRCY